MRRAALLALALLAVASAVPVLTAANHVPKTFAGESTRGVEPDDLKPAECAGTAVLSHLATPTGSYTGRVEDELILGGPAGQKLDGDRGDDCILGGAGDDVLVGGLQEDVCIGGPGNDTFHPSWERTFP